MRILFCGDWHLDLRNLDRTVAAADRVTEIIREQKVDMVVNLGDLVVSRGSIHPHVSWHLRRIIQEQSAGREYVVLKGNHDDSYHADRKDTLWGVLGGSDDGTAVGMPNVRLVSEPVAIHVSSQDQLVLIPSPNKHDIAAWLENNPDASADPRQLLAAVTRGLIAEANPSLNIVACFHGTVDGAVLDNEQTMPAGAEYSLPRDAFRGADLVMAGHIHKPQSWPDGPEHPPGHYVGSIAALTWGEKHQPRVMILDTETMDVMSIDLPCQQMIQRDVSLDGKDDPLGYLGKVVVESAERDARLRVVVRGSQATLSIITQDWIRNWIAPLQLADMTVVKHPTDDVLVRMDFDRKWTIEDAFREWLKQRGVSDAEEDALIALAREVEESVRDDHLDARYDFRPIKLEATNWCQYPVLCIDMQSLTGLVNVMGPNAAGKSNLARAVIFALFRKQLAGRSTGDLIRRGEQTARVVLTFASGSQEWRIVRDIRAGVKTSRVDTTLLMKQNEVWLPASEGTARETQEQIDRLVGPWELFCWTNWAGQNDVGRLLHLTPAELKEVLLAVLQRNWDARIEYAKDQIRNADNALLSRDADVRRLEEIKERLAALETEKQAAEAEVETAKRTLNRCKPFDTTELEKYQADHAQLKGEVLAKTEGIKLNEAEADLRQINDRILNVQTKRNGLGPDHNDPIELRAQYGEAEVKRRAAVEELNRRDSAVIEATDKLKSGTVDQEAKVRKLHELLEEMKKSGWKASTDVTNAKKLLDDAKHRSKLLDQVPCEGETWIKEPPTIDARRVEANMGECKFLVEAAAAHESIELLTEGVESAEQHLVECRKGYEGFKANHDEAHKELEDLRESLVLAIDAATGERDRCKKELAEAEDAANKLDALIRLQSQKDTLDSELESLGHAKKSAEKRLNDVKEMIVEVEKASAAVSAIAVRIDQLLQERDTANRLHDSAVGELKDAQRALDNVDGRIEANYEMKAQLGEVQEEVKELQRSLVLWRQYLAAMHRDGIPYTMLERFALPQLGEAVNRYLQQTDLRVSVHSERALASGELRNEVVMAFTDPRGTHDLSSASGFQESAIGLAFLAALGDLTSTATGSEISWFAVDEGLGTMDPVNLDGAKSTLKAIAQTRKSFWIISHVGGIDEAADCVLRVIADGEVSEVMQG